MAAGFAPMFAAFASSTISRYSSFSSFLLALRLSRNSATESLATDWGDTVRHRYCDDWCKPGAGRSLVAFLPFRKRLNQEMYQPSQLSPALFAARLENRRSAAGIRHITDGKAGTIIYPRHLAYGKPNSPSLRWVVLNFLTTGPTTMSALRFSAPGGNESHNTMKINRHIGFRSYGFLFTGFCSYVPVSSKLGHHQEQRIGNQFNVVPRRYLNMRTKQLHCRPH